MKEYKINILEDEEEIIDAEKMTAEELYKKLSEGFPKLYVPADHKHFHIMMERK